MIEKRCGWLVFVMLLALAGGVCLPSAAMAYDEVHLYGFLESRDLRSGKIVVSGREFVVTDRSRLFDEAGKRIELKDMKPFDIHGHKLFTAKEATTVDVRAAHLRGHWLVQSMKLTKGLPN